MKPPSIGGSSSRMQLRKVEQRAKSLPVIVDKMGEVITVDYRPSFVLGETVKRWIACTKSTIQANTFDALHLTPDPLLEVPCFRDDAVLEKVEFGGTSLKTTCRYAYYANPKCQTPSGQ